jgi:uncharacterized protein DUF3106
MRTHYISALLAMLLLAAPLCAGMQQPGRPGGAGVSQGSSARPQSSEPNPRPNPQPQYAPPHQFYRGQGPHNGDWLRNNLQLPPQERQRRLEQDPRFRQLPPERREQLLNRLHNFNAMPLQEQQRVLNRMEMLEHLPPEQQRRAQDLFGQFRGLEPQRKQMMRGTLRQMRNMPPDARLRFLGSPGIRSVYSPDEIRMLYDFNSIGFVTPEQ